MYKEDLALNNLQWLICHKPNQTRLNQRFIESEYLVIWKQLSVFVQLFFNICNFHIYKKKFPAYELTEYKMK